MKHKAILVFLVALVLVTVFILKKRLNLLTFNAPQVESNQPFELQPGDILVRPNWWWLPGSVPVAGGRKYGHVAIVVKGSEGKNIEEALEKADVVEALFYDQATRHFQFKKENQVRKGKAIVSFGKKFSGMRYRLRTNLTPLQTSDMIKFLESQLDGGYNLLSAKKKSLNNKVLENANWHCATIVWHVYYHFCRIDIDANKGLLIYPSDIIANPEFDKEGGRIRF